MVLLYLRQDSPHLGKEMLMSTVHIASSSCDYTRYWSSLTSAQCEFFFLVPGYLRGYVRRFAQSSHDHRGTPEVFDIYVRDMCD